MWITLDIEADGPVPGLYSMVSFGAVVVEPGLTRKFRGETAPITDGWQPEALAISGVTRPQHLGFPHAWETMSRFDDWLKSLNASKHIMMLSDNPAFDFMFIAYYLHRFVGECRLGYGARRIGDLWSGHLGDAAKSGEWKKFAKTPHDHDPLNDAMGMAEALLEMSKVIRMHHIPLE